MTMFENGLWGKCTTLNILTVSEPCVDCRANKSYLSIAVKMFNAYTAATRTVDIVWAKRKIIKMVKKWETLERGS